MVPLAFLSRIPWTAVGIVAGVLVLGGLWARGSYYAKKYDAEHVFASVAADINANNAKIAVDKEAQVKAADAVSFDTHADIAAVKVKITKLKKVAANAPPSTCDLGPELHAVVDGMPSPADADSIASPGAAFHPSGFTILRGTAGQTFFLFD